MPNGLSCSTEEHVWGYGRAVMRMRGGMFRHDEKDIGGQKSLFRTTKGDELPHKSI